MIELLYHRKFSKIIFNIGLILVSICIVMLCSYFAGEAKINYVFGAVFWITGRYFYAKIGSIINPEKPPKKAPTETTPKTSNEPDDT